VLLGSLRTTPGWLQQEAGSWSFREPLHSYTASLITNQQQLLALCRDQLVSNIVTCMGESCLEHHVQRSCAYHNHKLARPAMSITVLQPVVE
jgi:hypothetical protein